MVVGPELEARLAKTVLPGIEPAEMARPADACRPTSSCVIKATLHKRWSPPPPPTRRRPPPPPPPPPPGPLQRSSNTDALGRLAGCGGSGQMRHTALALAVVPQTTLPYF